VLWQQSQLACCLALFLVLSDGNEQISDTGAGSRQQHVGKKQNNQKTAPSSMARQFATNKFAVTPSLMAKQVCEGQYGTPSSSRNSEARDAGGAMSLLLF